MFNHITDNGTILASQGKALIRLIPKTEKPLKINDYRPISLLNSDYKIIASVLALRLRKTLNESISDAQKGGVPGRLMHDNLCLYRDVIQHIEERSAIPMPSKMGAAIISVDLEKAYDLVNREVLWQIMYAMGYPSKFIGWLQALYKFANMVFLNGNNTAGELSDVQSIRQGCPLSMHLFAIYIEPLLVTLNRDLTGVIIQRHKVAARAIVDDVVIFASSFEDIKQAGSLLDRFCSWTRARLNQQKTKALCLGDLKPNLDWPLPWLESTDNLKLLGIRFSNSIIETASREWESTIQSIKGTLAKNASRNLTLYGRVQFVKTYILPLAIYKAQVLPCGKSRSERILNAITSFIWSSQLEWPNRGNTHRPILQGGLGIPNPFLFFQSLFVRNVFKAFIGPESPERSLLRFWLSWPLRREFHRINNSSIAAERPPTYIMDIVAVIKKLMNAGLFTTITMASHRKIYHHLAEKLYAPGHIEKLLPKINWPSIWKWVSSLRGKQRDIIWLFNNRLLPTRSRVFTLTKQGTEMCLYCQKKEETDQHLTIECEKKKPLIRWLERKLRWLQCPSRLRYAIRGHVGNCPHPDSARALIAMYIETMWKYRQRLKLPTIDELENLWVSLRKIHFPL